ncbi:UBC-like protein [Corynespora cassiicola Philippines]|uniref:UBC-like protein n=1 Tax=Corynespora cassiicola Philippines TaxID=1448308 RepID=A0A2T2P6V9_CORCC|nr:UBC-like protein [Corynespora cassiicola Philippines]
MNSKSLRRLAGDHGSLHTAGLPPNYLFHPSSTSDDLTSLDVLLAGPVGTPYAKGVWRLHLDIPPTYPSSPPTATFRTRLWHPNIDESSGAVCVETLKRDWSSDLKLRDVLVTISCLLIQPNPASALNEAAGKLASEDWDSFCRRAKLMTEIHAPVPGNLVEEVREAQMRGEDAEELVEKKEPVIETKGKGKAIVKATPATASKGREVTDEDEENLRRRGETLEPESDPESDWIPGPTKLPKTLPAGRNVFGIKGIEETMPMDTQRRIVSAGSKSGDTADEDSLDDTDPFMAMSPYHGKHHSFSLRVPPTSASKSFESSTKHKPQPPKASQDTLVSETQPEDRMQAFLDEFSWSWQDAAVMHDTGILKNGPAKEEVRKRLAGSEFEDRRLKELKLFKKAGCDLKRYNRGDFGPRTGIRRL